MKISLIIIIIILMSCNLKEEQTYCISCSKNEGSCVEYGKDNKISKTISWYSQPSDTSGFFHLVGSKELNQEFNKYKPTMWRTVEYNERGGIKETGMYLNNDAYGYFNYYVDGILYHIRQYEIVQDESIVNQYINIDANGFIDKSMSNFFTMSFSHSDTIGQNELCEIEIDLCAPYFPEGKMEIVIGDFDFKYQLRDSTTLDTIKSDSFNVKFPKKFNKTGYNVLRGKILNYTFEKIKEDTLRKQKEMYFNKLFFVVAKE